MSLGSGSRMVIPSHLMKKIVAWDLQREGKEARKTVVVRKI